MIRRAVTRDSAARDGLAIKLAIAVTLPDVDITRVIQLQRSATLRTLQVLTHTKSSIDDPDTTKALADLLVIDSLIFAAEAAIRWLDHSEIRLERESAASFTHPLAIRTELPKRGRPAKTTISGAIR